MDEKATRNLDERRELIGELVQNILESAKRLAGPNIPAETLEKGEVDIRERLEFEANVALNEIVTRFGPKKEPPAAEDVPKRTFLRFGVNFRTQHMLMIVSVITLIITGIPLKFPELGISRFIILDVFGGLANSTLVHRVGAVGLIAVGIWHLGYTAFSRAGLKDFLLMIPRTTDIIHFFHTIMYFVGRRTHGPKFGRFSFIEKFDYWAVYWGMVIMIGSGLILWFKESFPKYAFDIAREAHSDEGLLATLAIVIWHFYNVHFNPEVFPMSWVWWHGQLTEEEMKHHHPLEYAAILETERRELTDSEIQSEGPDKAES